MAIKLSAVLGGSAKFWLNLQDNYSLWMAEQKVDTTQFHRLATLILTFIEKQGFTMCSHKYLPLWDLIKTRVFENHKIGVGDYNYHHENHERICIKIA